MRTLRAERRAVDPKALRHKAARPEDCSAVVAEPFRVVDGSGRTLLACVRPEVDPEPFRRVVRALPYVTTDRSGGMRSVSCIFGSYPRVAMRIDMCRSAATAATHPSLHAAMVAAADVAAAGYRAENPALYEAHRAHVRERVLPDWRMGDTPFTSGIANHTNPLHYHQDAGNFPGFWSAMFVLKAGVDGGLLCFPELDLAADFPDGTLVLFDGQSLIHGITPIRRLRPDGYRHTVVYYSLQQLWKCLPPGEELARIRRVRTEREGQPRSLARVKGKAR
jgi:hypothetical protein